MKSVLKKCHDYSKLTGGQCLMVTPSLDYSKSM